MSQTKLCLTKAERDAIASNSGAARRAAWAQARSARMIPSHHKLGVETSDQGAALFVKNTFPRQYVYGDDAGRYSHCSATAPVAAPVAPVQNGSTPVNGAGSFLAADGPDSHPRGWQYIDRLDLVELLRDNGAGSLVTKLPDGFPDTLGADAVVLDGATGRLYFREND